MNKKVFIFIGRSGCGKGTQAKHLINKLSEKNESVYYVSTGDEFRRVFSMDTYTSNKLKGIVDSGVFAPTFTAVSMWTNALMRDLKEDQHIIIDGTPRSVAEAMTLDSLFPFYDAKPIAIYIDVSRAWASQRLTERGRKDDTKEGIDSRMDLFDTAIIPILHIYEKREDIPFLKINGEQSIDAVHMDLMRALEL